MTCYTSQTNFLFEGGWYSGENTLNPNIKEVAMGTHLPGVFKDSEGKKNCYEFVNALFF